MHIACFAGKRLPLGTDIAIKHLIVDKADAVALISGLARFFRQGDITSAAMIRFDLLNQIGRVIAFVGKYLLRDNTQCVLYRGDHDP